MSKQKFMSVIVPVIAVVALILAGSFYMQLKKLKQTPQAQAQVEAAELTAKVGRLIVLPAGETPTIATVSDPAALKDQAFFANAQKGDKVLIYAQAKKAILYSPTLNKIIDVAPLNIGANATTNSVTPPATTSTTTKKN